MKAPAAPRVPNTSSVETWRKRKRARSKGASRAQWAREASSSSSVPSTFVWTNTRGPSIERSTWLSAAKFSTASGAWAAKSASTAARSAMSICSKAKRGLEAASRRLSRFPA